MTSINQEQITLKDIIKQYKEFDSSTAKILATKKAMQIQDINLRNEILEGINKKYSSKTKIIEEDEEENTEDIKPKLEWTKEEIEEYDVIKHYNNNSSFNINIEEERKKMELYQYDDDDNVIRDKQGRPILKQQPKEESKVITKPIIKTKFVQIVKTDIIESDDDIEDHQNNIDNNSSYLDRVNKLIENNENTRKEIKDFKDIFNDKEFTKKLQPQNKTEKAFQGGIKGGNWQVIKLEEEKQQLNIL